MAEGSSVHIYNLISKNLNKIKTCRDSLHKVEAVEGGENEKEKENGFEASSSEDEQKKNNCQEGTRARIVIVLRMTLREKLTCT